MSRPCLFHFVAVDLAIDPFVAGADKPQVSALNLNRGKFVKKPNDLIRRKFSIDAACAIVGVPSAHPPFRNHTGSAFGNLAFTIRAECDGRTQAKPASTRDLSQAPAAP
jgi:hypothetical protein